MKVKNLEVGLRVQVKSKNHKDFFRSSAGKCGVIDDIDSGASLDVRIKYDDGRYEWGNHKGLKRAPVEPTETSEPKVQSSTPSTIGVGTRVRLNCDKILGFVQGDVGTVKLAHPNGVVAVYFDTARDGWGEDALGIPDLHGLYVPYQDLEIIQE